MIRTQAAAENLYKTLPARGKLLQILAIITLMSFIVWASVSEIDEVTRGMGKVIPSSRVQAVQNLEGGIVSDILVEEGDQVEQGQVLMTMDDTRFSSTLDGQRAGRYALLARKARLEAEISGATPEMPQELLEAVPELASQEMALFHSRIREINSRVAGLEQQLQQKQSESSELKARRNLLSERLSLLEEELQLSRTYASEGAVSKVELLRLRREVGDARGERNVIQESLGRLQAEKLEIQEKIREVTLVTSNEARIQLNETLAKLHEAEAKDTALSDQVERTNVRAPLKGIVKQILVNTEGGVVQPGMNMMEIVPLDDTLQVETRIRPEDIAFLHPGQKAVVRFSAYDFTIYGGLEGELTHISADTITDENGDSFYLANVKTRQNYIGSDEDSKPVIAGMVATVDILTGKKTLLAYFLKPLLRAKQLAFSER
ncbi:MAG: HlyD family type I secretion periplasmic adaptor subunit [Endozoicomonas sp.]